MNDNDPVITSSESFSADENQTAIGTVTATDADNDDITFSISGSELAITSAGVLTFASAPDYETKSSYTATVTASDGTNNSTQSITVSVNNLNDNDPVITSSESFSADENQTAIGTVTATDADNDDITFSISGSELAITSAGVLTFASAPDYETKSSYTATVTASDGTNNSTQSITVSINDLNDGSPVMAYPPLNNTINVIEGGKLSIWDIRGQDQDGDAITISLSGSDSSQFEIQDGDSYGNTAYKLLRLKNNSDYESKSQYNLTVNYSDGQNTSSTELVVNVIDGADLVGDAIKGSDEFYRYGYQTKISNDGSVIAVKTAGPDNYESNFSKISIYNFVNNQWSSIGTINNSNTEFGYIDDFDINDDGTIIALTKSSNARTLYVFEYVNSQWTQKGSTISGVTKISLDSSGTSLVTQGYSSGGTKIFDFREANGSSADWVQRGDSISHTGSVLRLSPLGNIVAISAYVQPDVTNCGTHTVARGNLYIYEWSSSSWSLKNTLTGCDVQNVPSNLSTGRSDNVAITWFGQTIDFTSAGKYLLVGSTSYYYPETTNGNTNYALAGTYSIHDVLSSTNYGPALWLDWKYQNGGPVSHNAGRYVGLINWGNSISESSNPYIYIDSQLDEDYVGDTVNEASQKYNDYVNSNTSWDYYIQQRDAPAIREYFLNSNTWEEGTNVIYGNKYEDQSSDVISGAISGDGARIIKGEPGRDKRFSSTSLTEYGHIQVRDIKTSTVSASQPTLGISDVNITINENGGTFSINSSDADGDSYRCILSGRDESYFNLNSSSTCSSLFFASSKNFESHTYPSSDNKYRLKVMITDGVYWESKHLNIGVGDVNDAPYFTSASGPGVDENQQSVITLAATDEDGDTLTFAIDGGTDASLFTVNSSTGVLTFVSSHTPDYETKTSYSITVSVSDGTATTQQNLTVIINNTNDQAPVFTSDATFSTPEFNTTGSGSRTFTIGDVNANDPDGLGSITYSISGSEISIDSSSGVIAFTNEADYETKNTYTATVTASDGGLTAQQNITVNVTNSNDNNPVFTSSGTFNANENQTAIGTVTATDADNDTITFTVSGDNLQITSAGVLSFTTAPDYETKNTYTGTVTASDNSTDPVFGARQATQDITVNVNNVNESAPVINDYLDMIDNGLTINENETTIATISATDADGDNITYSIERRSEVGNNNDVALMSINSTSGVLSFNSAPDWENPQDYNTGNNYLIRIRASDGNLSHAIDVTVNVQNVDGSVSGSAYSSRFHVIDSDVPNTTNHASSNNGSVSTAQTVINPSRIHGHVGDTDTIDLYKISTTSSMYANLDVIDYVNDSQELRLYIYESDGTSRTFSYTAASLENNMSIVLPNDGDYLLGVAPLNGSSSYILTIGQRYESSAIETSTDFIPDFIQDELMAYKSEFLIPDDSEIDQNTSPNDEAKLIEMAGIKFEGFGVFTFSIEDLVNKKAMSRLPIDAENTELGGLSNDQKNYLDHWSVLQDFRSLSKEILFDLNVLYKPMSFTRDPAYSLQWNLQNVNLEAALNAVGQDVKDVAVAVIDTGGPTVGSTAWNESNLIDGGYDFYYGVSRSVDNEATLSDGFSHGIHVSTTIAAKNNGAGINGYAVHALNINVFNNKQRRPDLGAPQNVTIEAVRYAAGLSNSSGSVAPNTIPIKVINLSLGGPGYSAAYCQAMSDAISAGVVVVAASGNEEDTDPGIIYYPASCNGVISVGSTNSAGGISYYSTQNQYVDISAPGGDYSDRDGDGYYDLVFAYGNNSDIRGSQGTSMASPQVAAMIALMYAENPNLNPSTVQSMIEAGELSDDRGASGRDNAFGYGEINVAKALDNVFNDTGDPTTYAYTSASYLDYGSSTSQINIDLLKVGTGSLSVSNLTADSATGLSYNSSVDSSGFGTYTIILDRSSITDGEFSNTLYFNLSNGESVAVSLYYQVGTLRSRADIGKVFVGMYNASDSSLWGSGVLDLDGNLPFVTTSPVAAGNYYIITSTDIDGDGTICESGEICEYFPPEDQTETYFTVEDEASVSGYELYLKSLYKNGGANAASFSLGFSDNEIQNKLQRKIDLSKNELFKISNVPQQIPESQLVEGKFKVFPN